MNQSVQRVEYTLMPEDFIYYQLVCARKFGVLKYRLFFFLAFGVELIGVLALSVFSLSRGISRNLFICLICLALITLGLVLLYLLYPILIKRSARDIFEGDSNYHYPMMLEFYEDVLVISYRHMRMTWGWRQFVCCFESTTHFCFVTNKNGTMGVILPKSCLTQQQVESVSQKINELFGKRHVMV